MNGVQELKFDLLSHKVDIRHTCSQEILTKHFREIGFSPRIRHELYEHTTLWQKYQHVVFTSTSGILLVVGLIAEYLGVHRETADVFFAVSIACGGWRVAVKGFRSILQLSPDMNALMIIAALAAAVIGKSEEGAAVVFLFAVSNIIERYSLERSRRRIRSLMGTNPATVSVFRDGNVAT